MQEPEATLIVVCGRAFSAEDLAVVRQIIAAPDEPVRAEIARRTCVALNWFATNGRPKAMSCRVALLRLERQGLIRLPAPRTENGNRLALRVSHTLAEPLFPIPERLHEIDGLVLRRVESKKDSRVWNEAIARFHYLGYTRLPGAQVRYLVESSTTQLAAIGFGASAWKIAPRDEWIGWTAAQREKRLHLIVNNARFLILPWVRVKNLASWILARCERRLREDFQEIYGYRPVLLETFVESERFRGCCYAAANWQYLGETKGRGKLDVHKRAELPVKKIFVRPLVGGFRTELLA